MRKISIIAITILLSGCANSADHEVMLASRSYDQELTCSELRFEKRKAQSVIDSVNQDKNDMTGADVVDGMLWFPFNVIAKQSNYSEAVKAANKRIDYVIELEIERKCNRK